MVHLLCCFHSLSIVLTNVNDEIDKSDRFQIGELSLDNMLNLQDVLANFLNLNDISKLLVVIDVNCMIILQHEWLCLIGIEATVPTTPPILLLPHGGQPLPDPNLTAPPISKRITIIHVGFEYLTNFTKLFFLQF